MPPAPWSSINVKFLSCLSIHPSGLFKGQFTTAQVGQVERRRRRGGWGVGGVSPSHRGGEGLGKGLCSLSRKIFDFGSQYGEFWCILDGIFYSSATR